ITDPVTGRYQLSLPVNQAFTLRTTARYDGYQLTEQQIQVSSHNLTADIAVPIDPVACDAPGYRFPGTTQSFNKRTTPQGWSVVDSSGAGNAWRFDNPDGRQNNTKLIDNLFYTDRGNFVEVADVGGTDTSLVSPPVDLSGFATPVLRWGAY